MHIAAYGTWQSALSPEVLARGLIRYGFTGILPDGSLCISEQRPAEQGRTALVQVTASGERSELLPAPYSARSRVHEYGGRSFGVGPDKLWFVNQSDQQVYARSLGPDARIQQLTAAADTRFAELTHDARRHRLLAVAERHLPDGSVYNFIAHIDLHTGQVGTLAAGRDFYASIALAPDGGALAYLAWDHPHMPWDAAELHLASITPDGALGSHRHVAGDASGSASQPTWSRTQQLYFALEVADAWALQRVTASSFEPLAAISGEVGAPLWSLGTQLWGLVGEQESQIVATAWREGRAHIVRVDVHSGVVRELSAAFPYVSQLLPAGRHVYLTTGSSAEIVRLDAQTAAHEQVGSAHEGLLASEDTARPVAVRFPTSRGDHAHGFFYAPTQARYSAPTDTRPPLIVLVHGGPTAGAAATFDAKIQYFTTRGFAVLDVNYRGSTGFGRAYRERLRGEWGILDVDDCVAGARYLAESDRVDAKRMVIRGGSAGGYTVLQALANHDVFAAGSCHYGISDLEALSRDTHKFESHYDRYLVGQYPAQRDLFIARSPIHYPERIQKPVIFFQGLEDRVVPADQTERIANTLIKQGIAAEYHAYEGEHHGFRKAETIQHVLETELAFLRKALHIQ